MTRIWHYWVPAGFCLLGIALIGLGGWTGDAAMNGAPIFAAGAFIWIGGIFYRISQDSRVDRDAETAARAYFAKHGHWPDESPPPPR